MTTLLAVEHREHATDRSLEMVLAALVAATGSVEEGFATVAREAGDLDEFERTFKARESDSGFMIFMKLDHGAWMSRFYERPTKAMMIILGNPLLAITMLRHDVRAGLNVPVRVYLHEDEAGRTHVSYDVPSTLMGNLADEARAAASVLDAKLAALVAEVVGQTTT